MEELLLLLARVFFELIFECLLKLPGYAIIRFCEGRETANSDPDGCLVLLLGLLFWGVVLGILLMIAVLMN